MQAEPSNTAAPDAEATAGPAAEQMAPGPEANPQALSSLLFGAIASSDAAGLRILLNGGASTDVRNAAGSTPILEAIRSKNAAVVGALLDHGVDTNLASTTDGTTPLFLALRQGNIPLAETLLDKGAGVACS